MVKMMLPSVIYGTAYRGTAQKEQMTAATEMALKAGFTAFDSATISFYSEAFVGAAFKRYPIDRDKIWIQTKFTPRQSGAIDAAYNNLATVHDQLFQSLDWSLRTLGTEYLDAYILHSPFGHPNLIAEDLEAWRAMEEIYHAGRTHYLGVSNMHLSQLKEFIENAKIKPTIVQNHFNYRDVERDTEEIEILQFCLENAITYQGFGLVPNQALNHDTVSEIAKAHNASNAQVIWRFSQEIGITPVMATTKERYIQEDATIDFSLSLEEVTKINDLLSSHRMLLSLFSRLQSGELMRPQAVVDAIMHCSPDTLSDTMQSLESHIAKIDPTNLAKIIAEKEPDVIAYLKQYGADFTQLSSHGCASIIAVKGASFLPMLQNALNIPAEKLLMATSQLEERQYFDALFQEADFSMLSPYEIVQIIKSRPDVIEAVIRANVAAETLLVASLSLEDHAYFNDLMMKLEGSTLSNRDLMEIIHHKGLQVIDLLDKNGADFSKLTYKDCEILLEAYGVEVAYALHHVTHSPVHQLLLPVLILGYTDLFNDLFLYTTLPPFDSDAILKILTYHPDPVDFLLKAGISAARLLPAASMLDDKKYFNDLIDQTDLSQLYTHDFVSILEKYPSAISDLLKAGCKIEKLLVAASYVEDKKYFNDFMSQSDLNKLGAFDLFQIILGTVKSIYQNGDLISQIADEIHALSTDKEKKEALGAVQDCMADQACYTQCLDYVEESHYLEFCGYVPRIHEEL